LILKEFKVFRRKFTWTKTKIINYTILTCWTIVAISIGFFKYENSIFVLFLIIFPMFLFSIGTILKWTGFKKREQLQGFFSGVLIFEKDFISLNNNKILLEDIRSIEISNNDWLDKKKYNYYLDFNYENDLSCGVSNCLIIELLNNEVIKTNFLQENWDGNDFVEIQDVITYYYVAKKMGYLNAIEVLRLTVKSDYEAFKKLKTM
jgi:hypothetical protein